MDASKKVKKVTFSVSTPNDILSYSVCEVNTTESFDGDQPKFSGLFDLRMGTTSKHLSCLTCKRSMKFCQGHFGHILLAKKVYWSHYISTVIKIMQMVCYQCKTLLDPTCKKYAKVKNNKKFDIIHKLCNKKKSCPDCGTDAPKYKRENFNIIRTVEDDVEVIFADKCEEFLLSIDKEVYDIIGIPHDKVSGFICTILPVAPPAIRPSVYNGNQRSEDDMTFKYWDIIKANNNLRNNMDKATEIIERLQDEIEDVSEFVKDGKLRKDLTAEEKSTYRERSKRNQKRLQTIDEKNVVVNGYYELLQYHVFTLIDNNIQNIPEAKQRSGRVLKAIRSRLNGKTARVRGNLMGKRVDFSARTVVDGDPLIDINEVGVPIQIAMNLTYPEYLNEYNQMWLKELVENGPNKHPGCNFIILHRNGKEFKKNLEHIDKKILFPFETTLTDSSPDDDFIVLRYGDVIGRHLCDPNQYHSGDMVAFNRQPSLHRMNIMGHRVRVLPYKSFRLNPWATGPYNADFDGDEMNLHVPISNITQYEAKNIMNLKKQFISPQSNKPCMGSIMDTSLGLRMFVSSNMLFNKQQVLKMLVHIESFNGQLVKPIDKENMLWDGKQIFSMILPKVTYYERNDDGSIGTLIQNGKFIRGKVSKRMVGTGSRGLVHIIFNDYGPDRTVQFCNDVQRLICNWMKSVGFSVGISDIIPDMYTNRKIRYHIQQAKEKVLEFIDSTASTQHIEASSIVKQTFENKVIHTLNASRDISGGIASRNLTDDNSIKQMVSISKGSFINVSQIMSSVGQQNVTHEKNMGRVPDNYDDRPLPHFTKYDYAARPRGFIENSYYTGLTADEFYYHAMSGREGMINTSISTAETGYVQRQLVKILEDVVINYDMCMRNEHNCIIEYLLGGDGLNPCAIEKQPIPKYLTDMSVFEKQFKLDDNEKEYKELCRLKKIFEEHYYHKEQISLPINCKRIMKNFSNRYKNKTKFNMDAKTIFDMNKMLSDDLDVYLNRKNEVCSEINKYATMLFRIMIHMEFSYPMLKQNDIGYDVYIEMLDYIKDKFYTSLLHPGHGVGVLVAQSLGEPVMQCTLNTFHHSGLGKTNGVVKIKELITLSKNPKQRYNKIYFNVDDEDEINMYKNQMSYTKLSDIVLQTKIYFDPDLLESNLEESDWLKYDWSLYNDNAGIPSYSMYVIRLEFCSFEMYDRSLSMYYIYKQLMNQHAKKKLHIMFTDDNDDKLYMYVRFSNDCTLKEITSLLGLLSETIVCGVKGINRAFMNKETNMTFVDGTIVSKEEFFVETDGANLQYLLGLPCIDETRTVSDDINEMMDIFGIFAAAETLKVEMNNVLQQSGISIDHRHFDVLAKTMTNTGTFLPVNRHGSKKGDRGPLCKASFEETSTELTKSAIFHETDTMRGVSSNIIMTQLPPMGTGICDLAIDMDMVEDPNYEPEYEDKVTLPVLFDNERTKILGVRISQLNRGAFTVITRKDFGPNEKFITENIALKELEQDKIPLKIVRNLPNGDKEYWRTCEFEYK